MKKLVIALTVSAFALASALYASDTTPAPAPVKDKAACCDKAAACCSKDKAACCDKTTASDKSKMAACTDAKMACTDKSKSDCCGGAKRACSKTPSRRIAMSPKAAEQVNQ